VTIRILQHYWQLPLALLALTEVAIFFAAPYLAISFDDSRGLILDAALNSAILPQASLFAGVTFVTMTAMGLHNSRQRSRMAGRLARIIIGVLSGIAILGAVALAVPSLSADSSTLAATGVIAIAGSALLRTIFDRIVDEDVFKRKVLVYGAGTRAGSIAQLRRRADRRGFNIIGYVKAEGDARGEIADDRLLSAAEPLPALCERHAIDEIVVAMDDRRRSFPTDQLLECRLDGVEITDLATFFERETGKVRLDVLNPSWIIFSAGFRRGRINSVLERVFDVIASLSLLAFAWPFMFITALAIKLEDGMGASIFYRQIRVGQYGRNFGVLKFRSMREDAERDGQAKWATQNDSRVTRVGAFIRKIRIDELPQIINVLRGEMSFVGPRPERPQFVEYLNERIPYYRERHSIKPGITGWAQLCYPYGASDKDAVEKLQYDLYYVKNHSLILYLAILVQTVEVIVWGKGAR
jgi:sugar transferase (PEP-CTERM system associated)